MRAKTNKKAVLSRKEQKAKALCESVPRTTLSFYRYVSIADPKAFRDALSASLRALNCYGRIYVAREGINAQMNVPSAVLSEFDALIQKLPELNGVPYKIAVEEKDAPSFYKLSVKVKEKIVADGLDDSTFDPGNTGEYLTAAEFNEYVHDSEAVVVDMRNGYESEVGHFNGAITPDVDTFREELAVVPELLKVHKNKKIALYCTGGIRCEKASAYMKHLGFTDVRHLRGGIIDYKKQVDEEGIENTFKGKNFVFDERMGERISDDVIATCHLCEKEKCDEYRHCNNQACHILYISCEKCTEKYAGHCSYYCRLFNMLPTHIKQILIHNNFKKNLPQFKKHRLRPKVS